jgi:hypothetical protein
MWRSLARWRPTADFPAPIGPIRNKFFGVLIYKLGKGESQPEGWLF